MMIFKIDIKTNKGFAEITSNFKDDELQNIVSITLGSRFLDFENMNQKNRRSLVKKLFNGINIYDIITVEYAKEHPPFFGYQQQEWVDSGMTQKEFL